MSAVDSKIFKERWPNVHCVVTGSRGLVTWLVDCVFDPDWSELFETFICSKVLCFLLHFRQVLELHAWCVFDLKQLRHKRAFFAALTLSSINWGLINWGILYDNILNDFTYSTRKIGCSDVSDRRGFWIVVMLWHGVTCWAIVSSTMYWFQGLTSESQKFY